MLLEGLKASGGGQNGVIGSFEDEHEVYFSNTNAEGNVYQAQYPRILEIVISKFLTNFKHYWTVANLSSLNVVETTIKYARSFYFGDKIKVIVNLRGIEKDHFKISAIFQNVDTGQLHTRIVQKFYFSKEFSLPYPEFIDNGGFELNILPEYVNMQRFVPHSQIAEFFGNFREHMGLLFWPGFKKEVGDEYALFTLKAHYQSYSPILLGDKIKFLFTVTDVKETSFTLQGDFVNLHDNTLKLRGFHKIGYAEIEDGQPHTVPIPDKLLPFLQI